MARGATIRREEILRLARTTGLTSVDELSERFGVTASTIRRDLALLEGHGRLARTYGGAMALSTQEETSVAQRRRVAGEAKHAIAVWSAEQIEDGETILLDSGTTTAALARELRGREDLTVVTTNLSALVELGGTTGPQVVSLGGAFRRASQGFVGPLPEAALERLSFDRVFLGADSVTADDGICEADIQQIRLKELMMRRADNVYVLVHADKLGRRPFHAWAPLPSRWTLVTDEAASPAQLAPFRERGVTVEVVHSKPVLA